MIAGGNRGFVSRATAISDKGYVVGQVRTTEGGETQAFLWTPKSGIRVLSADDNDSEAAAVNDRGQVVGMHHHNPRNPRELRRAFFWQSESGMQDLDGPDCAAMAMNGAGQVVGWLSTPRGDSPLGRAFLWQADKGMQDLGDLRGSAGSFAWGINGKGQVVGESYTYYSANDRPLPSHMFLWQADKGPWRA
jgi:probable HAF family extracellular repeat protein